MSDQQETSPNVPARAERTPMKTLMALVLGVISAIYLINPTAGTIEFLPDVLPIIGNLDEATATAILLGSLSYFGIDLPWLRRR